MSFDVAGDAYDRFMGRYSGPLASVFVDSASPEAVGGVLDDRTTDALRDECLRRVGEGPFTVDARV